MAFFKVKERSLFVSLLFMLENLFYKSFLTIECILCNKIKATILVDTCITRFCFINEKFVEIVYEKIEI